MAELAELGKRMIKFRALKNISQSEFAKQCNLSEQTVCNIENGKQKPSKLTKAKIIQAMEN